MLDGKCLLQSPLKPLKFFLVRRAGLVSQRAQLGERAKNKPTIWKPAQSIRITCNCIGEDSLQEWNASYVWSNNGAVKWELYTIREAKPRRPVGYSVDRESGMDIFVFSSAQDESHAGKAKTKGWGQKKVSGLLCFGGRKQECYWWSHPVFYFYSLYK